MILKRCPFCDGSPELSTLNTGTVYSTQTCQEMLVRCQDCGAKGPQFHKQYLAEWTNYTVQDFRNNPILMIKEEEKYNEYCKSIDTLAVSGWNKRGYGDII